MTSYYATHSRFSDPGALAPWLDAVSPDLATIREAASTLVFHYVAHGDITAHGFPRERYAEINLRYAADLLARLHELDPAPPGAQRAPTDRVVGCCRDVTLLFVALARHHGIPARSRVGFGTYLLPEWAMDHVIAEVWDAGEQRWRLVEPQFPAGYLDPSDGTELDLLDVPRDKFLVGSDAWADCRAGRRDPERFVVWPDLPEPFLRSWPYLTHNVVLDLAALNKQEMILWDLWGVIMPGSPRDGLRDRLDGVAEVVRSPGVTVDQLRAVYSADGLRVPDTVTSVIPPTHEPSQVTLRTASP
jgi:hypothetical protein